MLRNGIENLENYLGLHSEQGKRDHQEDRVVGAKHLVNGINLLPQDVQSVVIRNVFRQMQKKYCDYINVGSTACVAIAWVEPDAKTLRVVAANLGDSHAHVLIVGKHSGIVSHYEQLTFPHKPDDPEELARINSAGGHVKKGRLNGRLAMSRAFGDNEYNPYGISHEPDISFFEFALADHDEAYIVVASDGLDALMGEDYSEVIAEIYYKHHIKLLRYAAAAKELVNRAINDFQSKDNCSAVVFSARHTPISAAVFDGHGGDAVSNYLEKFFYLEFSKHIRFAMLSEAQHTDAYEAKTESHNDDASQGPINIASSDACTSNYSASSSTLFAVASPLPLLPPPSQSVVPAVLTN